MKIAILGNFQVPFTTENDLAWSLNKLGHDVYMMQENNWFTEDVLARGLECDLLLYIHTHGWVTPGELPLVQVFDRLHKQGIPTASFHLDTWWGLERGIDVGTNAFWQTKYIFTADGGTQVAKWYRDKGLNHHWLKPGVVERDCYFADFREEFQHDVIFVGSRNYHPEWGYRPMLIDWLHENYGQRFAHYGNDGRRVVRGHELNQLYRSAKIVIGDSLSLKFDHDNYWSDRVYETLGRGGFMIHPYIKGMEAELKNGIDLAYYNFGDFAELKTMIDSYLGERYIDRERIRVHGHETVKNTYTYSYRMEEMLNIIKEKENG